MTFTYTVFPAVGGYIGIGEFSTRRFEPSNPRESNLIMVTAKASTPDEALAAARAKEHLGWAQARREGLA